MSNPIDKEPGPDQDRQPGGNGRIAFERLRERTDELELIISGLLAFALLALPAWVFNRWIEADVHVEGFLESALKFAQLLGAGLSYTLGVAFLIHLAIRGYWVGLIGLKATFPEGIRWHRLPLTGPIARAFYRERVADLSTVIDRADRAASILFAMTILVALSLIWIGVLIVTVMLIGALLGLFLGDIERIAIGSFMVIYGVFVFGLLLVMVIDSYLIRHRPKLQQSVLLRRWVEGMLRCLGVFIPQQLILPVQMTLQSNVQKQRRFMAFYFVILFVAPLLGSLQVKGLQAFAPLNSYDLLTDAVISHGMASAHYENLRSDDDRLRRWPMIPADRISEAHLRLFIPHLPRRDNPAARTRCPDLFDGADRADGPENADLAVRCLAGMWTVTLNDQPVTLAEFLPIERRDLGMRGLVGYLPLTDRAPGRHQLTLVWRGDTDDPGNSGEAESADNERSHTYRIPFWFTPGIEMEI